MTVAIWRIAADTREYLADDLQGRGAERNGGRWNRPGTALVYASGSIALACLETIAHLQAGTLPMNRYLVRLQIPDELWNQRIVLDPRDLEVGWDAVPEGMVSLGIGQAWATARNSALLQVPSAIVPEETNVLLNPAHPDSHRITCAKIRRFIYDARLVQAA